MVDLDALKRWADHLAPYVEDDNEWYRRGGIDGKDAGEIGELFAEVYAELSRHVSPQPSPDRAALVERMAQTIRSTWIDWEIDDTAGGKTYAAVAAEAALAAVEAAGWGPRPEAVTDGEIEAMAVRAHEATSEDGMATEWFENPCDAMRHAMIAGIDALPERFGVRREGAS